MIAASILLGASVVLVWRSPTERALDAALRFAADAMSSAGLTSPLPPGIAFASEPARIAGVALTRIVPVLVGFFLGVGLLDRGETWVHHAGPIAGARLVTTDDGIRDSSPPSDRSASRRRPPPTRRRPRRDERRDVRLRHEGERGGRADER